MSSEHQPDRDSTAFNSPVILFFMTIILFVALFYRLRELSLLAGLVLLLMAGSKAWSLISLSRVFCSFHLDKGRAFPQETVTLTTNVENAKFLPVWVRIQWPYSSVLGSMDEASIAPQESGLLWHQRARFHRSLKALRRGVYQVGPSHISTSDFFGFFKSKKKLDETVQIIVYPRLVELKPVDVPKHDLFGTPGDQSPVKDPVYVIGTHDYHPSRPSRHIHWKASARRLRLQEKIFEPSEQGKIMVVLDVGTFEKDQAVEPFEYVLEVIASLILQWTKTRLAVGFTTNGTTQGGDFALVPTGRSFEQRSTILEVLARLQMRQKTKLSRIMQQRLGPRRGVHYAHFCYQNGHGSDEMKRICRKRNTSLTIFAWRLNPASPPDQHRETTEMHLVKNIRLHAGTHP
jgi:uncharacterized protein (DUF58 family)